MQPEQTHIVLLHGARGGTAYMKSLEEAFLQHSYAVTNMAYQASKYDIADISVYALKPFLETAKAQNIVLIGYSLGGLIISDCLARFGSFNKVKRVLMIGTPFHGSSMVDDLMNHALLKKPYQWIYGKPGQQMGRKTISSVERALSPDISWGAIAGYKRHFWPSFSLQKPHDGIVSVVDTHLGEGAVHLSLPLKHLQLTFDKRSIDQALHFVKTGEFYEK